MNIASSNMGVEHANPCPRLAITCGEPAGIGPDLCVQLLQEAYPAELLIIGDAQLLLHRAQLLGLGLQLQHVGLAEPPRPHVPGTIKIINIPLAESVQCGRLNKVNVPYVLATLDTAIAGCLDNRFDALVTGPVQKSIINVAGFAFTGHTEYLAEKSNSKVVMMLTTPGLRVALATTHLPLREVSNAITELLLEDVLTIINKDMQRLYGIKQPRLLVCGLNPHAGESGHLGHEEREIIEPVLQRLRAKGYDLTGPLPADTAFIPKYLDSADVVLAMYHDQGLPVLKHRGFGQAINVTLGLPFIRTSVDHGTALDLTGTGKADAGSFKEAIFAAIEMVGNAKNIAVQNQQRVKIP